MPGTVKKLQFSEGTDVGAPTDLSLQTSTSVIKAYADDSAYVTGEGAAVAGSIYVNTTTKTLRLYANSAWRNVWIETDPSDATKLIVKDLSGQTTGVTLTLASTITANRTVTFGDKAGTVAVFSGNTLDAPSSGAMTVGSTVGAANLTLGGSSSTVVVAGDLTVQGTTTTLNTANLDVEDTNIKVNNGGNDASSEGAGITVDRTGTKGSIIYAAAAASKFKVGAQGSEVEVADISTAQNMTNKRMHLHTTAAANDSTSPRIVLPQNTFANLQAISGANHPNEGAMYWATDLNKPYVWDGSLLKELGSGGGGGSKNYLTPLTTSNGVNTGNGDLELGSTTGWSLGNVTLTSAFPSGVPTFGSGASGNLSISTVTSGSQLAGNYSLSYASSAATTAGNFLASDAFYIDTEDQAKPITISFRYKAQTNPTNANWSGTSSNSFGVAIYDVTNSAWIMPAGVWNLVQSSGVGFATNISFQTTSNSTQYRLVIFNANATSGAVTVYFDDFTLGPNSSVTAPAISDQVYNASLLTPNASAFGTVTNQYYTWIRRGNMMYVQGNFTCGTTGSASQELTLNGYTIDVSLLIPTVTRTKVGTGEILENTSANFGSDNRYVSLYIDADTPTKIYFGRSGASNVPVTTGTFPASSSVAFEFEIPISGWSSNTVVSQDTDTRVVASRATGTATGGGSSGAIIVFPTSSFDTHAAYSTSTGRYTVPVSGIYRISTVINASNATIGVFVYVNGSSTAQLGYTQTSTSAGLANGAATIKVNAGDLIDIRPNGNLGAFGANNEFSIERLSGPAVIAASESVNAKYQSAVNQSIANNSNTQTMTFATKAFDTHNAYNTSTGIYTVPVSGKYLLTANIRFTAYSASDSPQVRIYKNGTKVAAGGTIAFTTSNGWFAAVSDFESCNAGDTLEFRAFQASGSSQTLDGDTTENYLCIARIGN